MKKTNLYILLITVFATCSLSSMQQTPQKEHIKSLVLSIQQRQNQIDTCKSLIKDLTHFITSHKEQHPDQTMLTDDISIDQADKLLQRLKRILK